MKVVVQGHAMRYGNVGIYCKPVRSSWVGGWVGGRGGGGTLGGAHVVGDLGCTKNGVYAMWVVTVKETFIVGNGRLEDRDGQRKISGVRDKCFPCIGHGLVQDRVKQ